MRELIFTGKTVKEDKWVIGFYKIDFDDEKISKHYIYDKNFEYEVKPETIGQYTGVRDIKNHGIYEGDILLTNTTNMEIKVVIKWNEENSCFELTYENGVRYGNFDRAKVSNWKVIGNIHETTSNFSVDGGNKNV